MIPLVEKNDNISSRKTESNIPRVEIKTRAPPPPPPMKTKRDDSGDSYV